jgi:rSAM/selenodomain-associated transferase 1
MTSLEPLEPTTVVVFAKPPEPGAVKTRLTDRLSEKSAAELYRAFLDDVASMLGGWRADRGETSRLLAHAGSADHPGFAPFEREHFQFVDQGRGDLGDRLARIVEACFRSGTDRITILGSDAPTLQPRHVSDGFARLETCDVHLGPAFDGGYYLLQMDAPRLGLFEDVDWSTPRVTEQTLQRCREADLSVEFGEFWYDIDHFADLDRLRYHVFGYLRDGDHFDAPATARALRQLQRDEGVFELSTSDTMTPISGS